MRKIYNLESTLDSIVDFLLNAEEEDALKLWNVLTALRGPDLPGDTLKDATTSVIRKRLFKDSSIKIENRLGLSYVSEDSERKLEIRQEAYKAIGNQNHFLGHISRAFMTLDLSNLNRVNPKEMFESKKEEKEKKE